MAEFLVVYVTLETVVFIVDEYYEACMNVKSVTVVDCTNLHLQVSGKCINVHLAKIMVY